MLGGRPKHVHDLRLAGHYTVTAGLPAALAGDTGQTVLLFACACGSGPDSVATKVIPGRWTTLDLDQVLARAGGGPNGARHAVTA